MTLASKSSSGPNTKSQTQGSKPTTQRRFATSGSVALSNMQVLADKSSKVQSLGALQRMADTYSQRNTQHRVSLNSAHLELAALTEQAGRSAVEQRQVTDQHSVSATDDGYHGSASHSQVIQREVAFTVENEGATRAGFRASDAYGGLPKDQQLRYNQMVDDQQTEYTFRDKDHVLTALPNIDGDPPTKKIIFRDEDIDHTQDTTAYMADGATRYVKATRRHLSNWRSFVTRHAKRAKALVGNDSKDEQIAEFYNQAIGWAEQMDTKEQPETVEGDAGPEVSAPHWVTHLIKQMYNETPRADSGNAVKAPRFGGLENGMGKWASITFSKNDSFPEGSSASGTTNTMPWYGTLAKRRNADAAPPGPTRGHVYIRGHLLNDHIGGPSVASNLTPIVGVDIPGAPNANAAHSSLIEGQVRTEFRNMRQRLESPPGSPMPGEVHTISYTVSVTGFGGHNRTAKADVDNAHFNFQEHVTDMQNADGSKTTLGDLKNYFFNNQGQYAANWTNYLKRFVHTVCDSNDNTIALSDIDLWMLGNYDLWVFEDANLPQGLNFYYAAYDVAGKELRSDAEIVPAVPPNNTDLGYKHD